MSHPCLIDAIRAEYPHLRIALYAYEPGGDVTLEVLSSDDQQFTFIASTAEIAVRRAFPELFEAPVQPAAPTPDINLFD
jgi:hypothetical protein